MLVLFRLSRFLLLKQGTVRPLHLFFSESQKSAIRHSSPSFSSPGFKLIRKKHDFSPLRELGADYPFFPPSFFPLRNVHGIAQHPAPPHRPSAATSLLKEDTGPFRSPFLSFLYVQASSGSPRYSHPLHK